MRKLLIIAAIFIPVVLQAQNTITSDIVEGGKTLVELIKVIRTPRITDEINTKPVTRVVDSCGIKNLADISFKNKTEGKVQVSLSLRVGNSYDALTLSLTLSALSQENLYALKTGIYKYKIISIADEEELTLHEGELKLNPCDKLVREIK